jgi:hypothetical protein
MRGTLDPRLAGACLVVALLVAACGSKTSSSSAPNSSAPTSSEPTSSSSAPAALAAHALDVAAKIKAAGVGCADAMNDPGPHPEDRDTAPCTIGDDDIAITLFPDHDALVSNLSVLRQGTCYIAKTKPDELLTYVQGPNWTVFAETAADTTKIANATGGSVVKIDCSA